MALIVWALVGLGFTAIFAALCAETFKNNREEKDTNESD